MPFLNSTKEEMEQYQQLRKELLSLETHSEAKIQWNKLLGYDYYASLYRISNLLEKLRRDRFHQIGINEGPSKA